MHPPSEWSRPYRVYRDGYRARRYATLEAAIRGARRVWLEGPTGDTRPAEVVYASGHAYRRVGIYGVDGWRTLDR